MSSEKSEKYIEYNILLLKIVFACFTKIVNIIYWPVTADWSLQNDIVTIVHR